MNSLSEITKWHPLSLQKWLREIEEEDLLLVMGHLPEGLRHLIMENISTRLRSIINASIKNKNEHISKRIIERAKERILDAANELIDMGELSEPGEESEESIITQKTILPPVLTSNNTSELINTITTLSAYAKERGILGLEETTHRIKDPFLKEAIELVIDGTDPDTTEEILKNRVEAIGYYRDLLYSIMIEGALGIQSDDSTWEIETKIKSLLPPEMGQSTEEEEEK